ncbi:ROK family protein [Catenovulum sp. 2E275]|uniref:ROK family protein n=1 Tax=Catenovulum sp. 2E275 TaxID=2980497 RepID=UPI0021CF8138|nr:ROK family protein [Catenovulum sp. 2E275]MCU4677345.1 ROK family protein [Catenovulum sp. 2E275]
MIRIGIDFGGSKIEAAALDQHGEFLQRVRANTPDNYSEALNTIRGLVTDIEMRHGSGLAVGICMPGSVSTVTGKLRNSNRLYMNGKDVQADIESALNRKVKIANDANCFALSEAFDGAGKGKNVVCGIILGTGCGGGIVVNTKLVEGANGIAAEWGHNSLPWPNFQELNGGPECYCGKMGCLEQWISGSGLSRCYQARTKQIKTGKEIVELAAQGESAAVYEISALTNRLARAIASICNVVDPDVIVLGGGLSNLQSLYTALPALVEQFVYADSWHGKILPPVWGDSSGVRGAARLCD